MPPSESLADLGGDIRVRAREIDLLRFQIGELDEANLADPDEDRGLAEEEDRLSAVAAHQDAAAAAHHALSDDGGAVDALGSRRLRPRRSAPFAAIHDRLQAAAVEVADAATELRDLAEDLEDDPERLAEVRARRHLLRELRRKYGDELADVIAFRDQAATRLAELESHEVRVRQLEKQRAAGEAGAGQSRDRPGPGPAGGGTASWPRAVERRLRDLAMPRARFEVSVGADRAGDEITWLLAANPGEPALPLSKVASGGELARTMLAVRLVLGQAAAEGGDLDEDRRTLVFDEVDAGDRRGGGRRRRPGPRRSGPPPAGPGRHPPGPGGRLRRPADRGQQGRGGGQDGGPCRPPSMSRAASSSCRGCCPGSRTAPPPAATPRSCWPPGARHRLRPEHPPLTGHVAR